jgi:hypothetical protein
VESGLLIPLIGARHATVFGGLFVSLVTLLTIWRVPEIAKFRLDQMAGEKDRDEGEGVKAEA